MIIEFSFCFHLCSSPFTKWEITSIKKKKNSATFVKSGKADFIQGPHQWCRNGWHRFSQWGREIGLNSKYSHGEWGFLDKRQGWRWVDEKLPGGHIQVYGRTLDKSTGFCWKQTRAIRHHLGWWWKIRNLIRYGGWRVLTKPTKQDSC